MYRQCKLRKIIADIYYETTSFIPEPFCKVGKTLKLKDDNGVWDDGWVVISAGEQTSDRLVELISQAYRKSRKTTDI